MLRESDLVDMIGGLRRAELRRWVAWGWVVPERHDSSYLFRDIDIARVRLIVDIRREMAISEENVPMVLSLLDQIYSLRRELRGLAGAIEAQPESVRQSIVRHLRQWREAEPGG
jgi:chaperone modulatory protein CbpM